MAKLMYRTRGESSPQGKERVYFACHSADFQACFGPICADILRTHNCAIWYNGEPETPWTPEELEEQLSRMQLLVIPVTARFLFQPNPAREIEFRFAVEHQIPVLPLMQEEGLEQDFNRICGELQFLDRQASSRDATALPYEQRLERFLQSVLLGDTLAAQVRGAFDAYIFLSYRKTDRKHAQKLMRLIHAHDFCRDIAIWYDEFLVPGEDFNQAIRAAMEKSGVFAFVVTPNLLQPGNYVMTVEYPAAARMGKPMLPVEMLPTDMGQFQTGFPEMPQPADGTQPGIPEAVLRAWLRDLALAEPDDDPRHLFFIGLAYLSGIDVEEDRARGFRLIHRAAEANIPEAMEKLSAMYKTGEGTARDGAKAAQWLGKLAEYWEDRFARSGGEADGLALQQALFDWAEALHGLKRLDSAMEANRKLLETVRDCGARFGPAQYRHREIVATHQIAELLQEEGDLSQARTWYEQAMAAAEEAAKTDSTETDWKDVLFLCNALGGLCIREGDLKAAQGWYERSLELVEQLYRLTGALQYRKDTAAIYKNLGSLCQDRGDLNSARNWYQKCLDLLKAISPELDRVEIRQRMVDIYDALGELYAKAGNLTVARKWYLGAVSTAEDLVRDPGTMTNRRSLVRIYNGLGNLCRKEQKLSEARQWYERLLQLSEAMARESRTVDNQHNYAVACMKMGEICEEQKDLASARQWYGKSLTLGEQMVQQTGTVSARKHLSACCSKHGYLALQEQDLSGAGVWFRKALEMDESLAELLQTAQARRNVSIDCDMLGDVCQAEKNLEEAARWFRRGMEICRELVEQTHLVDAYDGLAVSYYKLALLNRKAVDWDLLQQSAEIWQLLNQHCPGTPRYQQNLQITQKLLALRHPKPPQETT